MTVNPRALNYVLEKLGDMQARGKIKIVRIGTRVPIHNPLAIKDAHFEAIAKLKNPRMMIHINHELELTPEALAVLQRFRDQCRGIIMSQSVLLRGVNDNIETLYNLFNKLADEGFIPYYVFQNDAVPWARHFTVPLPEAIEMWQKLRPMLSGVAATARFVVDAPNGYGKIAVPEGNAWDVDYDSYRDFKGKTHVIEKVPQPDPNEIAYMRDLANGLFQSLAPGTYVGYYNGQLVHVDIDQDRFFSELRKRGLKHVYYQQLDEEDEMIHIPGITLLDENESPRL